MAETQPSARPAVQRAMETGVVSKEWRYREWVDDQITHRLWWLYVVDGAGKDMRRHAIHTSESALQQMYAVPGVLEESEVVRLQDAERDMRDCGLVIKHVPDAWLVAERERSVQ